MYLLYGNIQVAKVLGDDNWTIYNFTSYTQGFTNTELIPPNNLGAISEYDFDLKYMNYILEDNYRFCKFMDIVFNFYYHKNIFLIINYEDWSINLVESLLKLIQQRYGINSTMVNEPEDLTSIQDVDFDPYYGIRNFDMDKARYLEFKERNRILAGGSISTY